MIDQVNCDEQPELATKFGIKGFPTILKIKKDKIETFEGDRTLDALEGFIDSE
jgi:thioredoxin-like negative regulator of GroEL